MALIQNFPPISNGPSASPVSKLSLMKARFQQRQQEEKEQKLFNMLEQQHDSFPAARPAARATNSSANSLTSSTGSSLATSLGSSGNGSNGKVRQMFDERRLNVNVNTRSRPPAVPVGSGYLKPTPAQHRASPTKGYDRSYPLDPLPDQGKRGTSLERPLKPSKTEDFRRSNSQYQFYGENEVIQKQQTPVIRKNVVNRSMTSITDANQNSGTRNGAKYRSPSESRMNSRRPVINNADNDETDYRSPFAANLGETYDVATVNSQLKAMDEKNREMSERIRKLLEEKQKIEIQAKRRELELTETVHRQQTEIQKLKQAALAAQNKADMAVSQKKVAHRYDSDDSRSDETVSSASSNGWVPLKPVPKQATMERNAYNSKLQTTSKAETAPQQTTMNSSPSISKNAGHQTASKAETAPKQTTNNRQSIFSTNLMPKDGLVPCSVCGRNFAPDRVDKHQTVCMKNTKKKRKVFDVTKMRVKGTEAETFVLKTKFTNRNQPKNNAQPIRNEIPIKQDDKPAWKKKHESFLETIRAAKAVQKHLKNGGKIADLPPPPASDTSDYIQCPHCGRRFSPAAAERHIPKCANIISNKSRR